MTERVMHKLPNHLVSRDAILRAHSRRADGKLSKQKLVHLMSWYAKGIGDSVWNPDDVPPMASTESLHEGSKVNMYYHGYKHGRELIKIAEGSE